MRSSSSIMICQSLTLAFCLLSAELASATSFQFGDSKLSQLVQDQLRPASAGRMRLGMAAARKRASAGQPSSTNTLGAAMPSKRSGSGSGGRPAFLKIAEAPPKVVEARQYGKTILECSASGNPAPTVMWLKNGQPLNKEYYSLDYEEERYSRFASDSMSETKSVLELDCLSEADAGLYECVADNHVKKTSVATEINVVSFADTGCVPRHSHNVDISSPKIFQWMGTYMQAMGSDAHLICRADGQHTTGWIAPDMSVITEDNPKYRLLSNGDLIIHDLSFQDMGMFKCIASNDNGEDMQETFVYPHASH